MEKSERFTTIFAEEYEGIPTGTVRYGLKRKINLPRVAERLGKYEDTGLSPEEIEELKHKHEKLQDFEVKNNEQLRQRIALLECALCTAEDERFRLEQQLRKSERNGLLLEKTRDNLFNLNLRYLKEKNEKLLLQINELESEIREANDRLEAQCKINEMLAMKLTADGNAAD